VNKTVLWFTAFTAFTASTAAAQRRAGGSGYNGPVPTAGATDFDVNNVPYDGRFTFVRLRYTPLRTGFGGGGGYFAGINYQWDHDYNRADLHFMTILRELTAIGTSGGSEIISIGSPDLFKYPVAYLVEAGWWTMTDDEALNLRNYFAKGGFIIFDDFSGNYALANFQRQLARILPDARLVPLDVTHPIFHSFFEIASLNFTHPYFGVQSSFLGVYEDNDPTKRLLLIANYNNDVGESWEWSDTGLFPVDVTNEAYKLGINYVVYAMTH
jgi:hypothetical protein